MKTLKFLLLSAGLFIFGNAVYGQQYTTAIGARLGAPLSASAKHFISENTAIEGILGFRGFSSYSWVSLGAALQKHNPIADVEGLQWYYGAGASAFFWAFDFNTDISTTTLGIQGYLGLDYKIKNAPISVTADWVPTIFINGYTSGFGGGYGSLGVRYVLK